MTKLALSSPAVEGSGTLDPAGAITRWISQVRNGDRAVAEPLWEVYFHRVVALARDRLRLQRTRELWASQGNS